MGWVHSGSGRVHAPVEDVRVVIDTTRQEPVPMIEAVVVRPGPLMHTEMPLAGHECLVASALEGGRERRHMRQKSRGGAVSGDDRAHAGMSRVAARQQQIGR